MSIKNLAKVARGRTSEVGGGGRGHEKLAQGRSVRGIEWVKSTEEKKIHYKKRTQEVSHGVRRGHCDQEKERPLSFSVQRGRKRIETGKKDGKARNPPGTTMKVKKSLKA